MKRGEIWTVAGIGDYTGKPRPVVIVQNSLVDATDSITICPITTDSTELPLFRVPVFSSSANGSRQPSQLMADKITTVNRTRLGKLIRQLDSSDMARLSRAIPTFLDLIETPSEPRP